MWMMAIVPGGFEEDAPQVRVTGLRDRAAAASGAARMLRRHEAHKPHDTGGRWKAARVAELSGDGERGQFADPAETPQPPHELRERLWRSLDALPPQYRRVAYWRYIHEMSTLDIAGILGWGRA